MSGHIWRCCSAVVERQARLIARWMHVGFIHGVMNTDNTALFGRDDRFRTLRLHGRV